MTADWSTAFSDLGLAPDTLELVVTQGGLAGKALKSLTLDELTELSKARATKNTHNTLTAKVAAMVVARLAAKHAADVEGFDLRGAPTSRPPVLNNLPGTEAFQMVPYATAKPATAPPLKNFNYSMPDCSRTAGLNFSIGLLPTELQAVIWQILALYKYLFYATVVFVIAAPLLIAAGTVLYLMASAIYLASHPELLIVVPIRMGGYVPAYIQWASKRMADAAAAELYDIANSTLSNAGFR
jgi:hypothetical protein